MFSFGGLATGLDTKSMISALVGIERIPIQRLQAKQSVLNAAKSTLAGVLSKFSDITSAAKELNDLSSFGSFAATSTSTAFTASVSGAATAGSYTIEVQQLAQATKTKSDAQTSNTAALGEAGTLDITVGADAVVNVTVSATDSLADIAANINASTARVNASVIYDGTDYYLSVTGTDTGASNAVSYGGVTLGLDSAGNEIQAAQDAQVNFDGAFTITRSTNQFSGVVPGLSFVVNKVTTGPETLTVASDRTAIVEKMTALVDAYNKAIDSAHTASGFGAVLAKNSELAGDSAIRSALGSLSMTMGSSVAGLTGKYNMMAATGLHLTRDGKLELDETKLQEALDDDFEAVQKVFVGDATNGIDGVMTKLIAAVDRASDGDNSILQLRADSLGKQSTRMDDDIDVLEIRLDAYEANLVKKFTAMELLVSQIQAQESALSGIINFNNNNR